MNPFTNFNLNQLNSNLARVPPPHSPLGGSSGGGGAGAGGAVSSTDFTNLAFWNQLTANQRLLLTQQFKNSSTILGAAAKHAFSGATTFPPSLPLNAVTDLKSMLDYKPKPPAANPTTNSSTTTIANNNGQFTKPNVPPLIPMTALEAAAEAKRATHSTHRHPPPPPPSASSMSSVPLNSSSALEDFNKKFKMTDEMKAVVQKVLSNPDLSTFIQTNSSNAFVPFISPPISPAIGASASPNRAGGGGYHHQLNNSTSLSIVPNPNVTITPQLPAHFSYPNHPNSPSSSTRQKSVICSTAAATIPSVVGSALNVPPSPSTSASTPSPSPTRSGSANSALKSSLHNTSSSHAHHHHHHHHHHHNNHHSLQQQQQQHHHYHHKQPQQQLQQQPPNTHTIPPMDVIDLSSPRRSLQAASAYLQQQQQQQAAQQQAHQAAAVAAVQQQQRLAAAAQHHSQQNGRSSSSSNSNSASMHLQRHAALAAAVGGGGGGNTAVGGNAGDNNNRLCVIPEIPTGNVNVHPYKVQKVYVENHLVPCINMKAYNDSEQLMTLTDFQKYFFPTVPLEHCKRIIEALGVELYKGNR